MSDIHLDDFYRDTARILVALYNHFPRKTTLYVEDIAGPDQPDEFGLHSPRHLACFHTILWLAQTDYLTYESLIRQEAADETVLSHRGFLLLTSALPTDDTAHVLAPLQQLIIHRIRHELKDGTSTTLARLMHQVIAHSRTFG